jgi:hypothetical protein
MGVFSSRADITMRQYIVTVIIALLTTGVAGLHHQTDNSDGTKAQPYVRNLYSYVHYLVDNQLVTESAALKRLGNLVHISGRMQIRGNKYRMVASQPKGFVFSKMLIVDKIIFLGDTNGRIYNAAFYIRSRPCLPKDAIFKTFGRFPEKDRLTDFPSFVSYSRYEKWGYYNVNVQRSGPPCVMMFTIKFERSRGHRT